MDTFSFAIEFTFLFFVWLFAVEFVRFIPRNYQRRLLAKESDRLDSMFESVQAEAEYWLAILLSTDDEAEAQAAFDRVFRWMTN